MTTWTSFSNEIATAVEQAATSVVQVHGRRRVAAGVVVADNLVLTPAPLDGDTAAVRAGNGQTAEGAVVGRIGGMGLTAVRVEGLGLLPLPPAATDAAPGHLAVAVGRTWSGGVMASLAPITVVGGPLRTGRTSAIERVIRIQLAPHGALNGGVLLDSSGRALGIVTAMAIRGTTVVIPASIAWPAAGRAAADGGTERGFLGISSIPVPIPDRQRAGRPQEFGLLVSQLTAAGPAERGGLLVGDLLVGFGGEPVHEPEELMTRLGGHRAGTAVPITVIRGTAALDVTVTIGERPKRQE